MNIQVSDVGSGEPLILSVSEKVNVSPRLVFVNPVYTLPGGFSGIPQFIS
jgi:hypothetical protein